MCHFRMNNELLRHADSELKIKCRFEYKVDAPLSIYATKPHDIDCRTGFVDEPKIWFENVIPLAKMVGIHLQRINPLK